MEGNEWVGMEWMGMMNERVEDMEGNEWMGMNEREQDMSMDVCECTHTWMYACMNGRMNKGPSSIPNVNII